jgi:hypothetical protein
MKNLLCDAGACHGRVSAGFFPQPLPFRDLFPKFDRSSYSLKDSLFHVADVYCISRIPWKGLWTPLLRFLLLKNLFFIRLTS